MAKAGLYAQFTREASRYTGRPMVFVLACVIIVVWLASGPYYNFNDTWQLLINTFTTLVTFLMVFLIQSSQNRDAEAVQLKLDELIRATRGAQNTLLDLEEMDEEELRRVHDRFDKIAKRAHDKLEAGDTVDSGKQRKAG